MQNCWRFKGPIYWYKRHQALLGAVFKNSCEESLWPLAHHAHGQNTSKLETSPVPKPALLSRISKFIWKWHDVPKSPKKALFSMPKGNWGCPTCWCWGCKSECRPPSWVESYDFDWPLSWELWRVYPIHCSKGKGSWNVKPPINRAIEPGLRRPESYTLASHLLLQYQITFIQFDPFNLHRSEVLLGGLQVLLNHLKNQTNINKPNPGRLPIFVV